MNASQRAHALEQHRREQIRWNILLVLYTGRPYPLGEDLILRTLGDADEQVGLAELRQMLAYLEKCDPDLIAITGKERGSWKAELTAAGEEVVEYRRDAPPGMARPAW